MIVEYEPSHANGQLVPVVSGIHKDSNDFLITDNIFWPTLLEDKTNPAYNKVMLEIENKVGPFGVEVFWRLLSGNRWVALRKNGSNKADIDAISKAYNSVKDIDWTYNVYPRYLNELFKNK